jgi:hypothetical protein
MTTPHTAAATIAEIISSVPAFVVSQMSRAYSLANTPDQQQAILDAMPDFGVTPAQALTLYITMQTALASIGLAGNLPAADLTIFQPQPDGSILYVAPPEPEQEPLILDPEPSTL